MPFQETNERGKSADDSGDEFPPRANTESMMVEAVRELRAAIGGGA